MSMYKTDKLVRNFKSVLVYIKCAKICTEKHGFSGTPENCVFQVCLKSSAF